jgi:hypothetical protein
MNRYRQAAIMLALLAGTSAASAQTTIITREGAPSQTVVTTRPQLVLTPSQRQVIYRDIGRERAESVPGTVEYRVGAPVPQGVELYPVPQSVGVEVPAVKAYRYMRVNGHVVLVDPRTSEVVAELSE